jgi:hypothetical protein
MLNYLFLFFVIEESDLFHLDQTLADILPMTIVVPDIGHCWPHCTSIPTEYWRERFFDKVCRNVAWLNI